MQSNGKIWVCPFQTAKTQYNPHPEVERNDHRRVFSFAGFRCQICKKETPGEATRLVVAHRPAVYIFRPGAHKFVEEKKKVTRNDPGGTGIEIAREVLACRDCEIAFKNFGPKE